MEAFKIKNGLSAKRYLGNTTTLSGSTIDLSLGSMFSTTLSSDPAYTFTNPPASGNAQAFSVEVTGGSTTFTQDSFATTLYTGNAGTQTITNNFDLSTNGGMIWFKSRTNTYNHVIFDTERWTSSDGNGLFPNADNAEGAINELTSFNTDGFGVTGSGYINDTNNMVAWSFKKQAKFFDIVTWTGDGNDNRQISHSLGSAPATIIIKSLNFSNNWLYNTNFGASSYDLLYLDLTNAASSQNYSTGAIKSAPTDSTFTLKNSSSVNGSGNTYVAYLFAHDTASDSRIQCGSYTGTAASQSINLGWKPQWLLIKSTGAADWYILDTTRGWTSTSLTNKMLNPNSNTAESTVGNVVYDIAHSNTGFDLAATASQFNASGQTYIYMAIRGDAATDSAITWPSSVKWPSGVAPTTPAAGTKDLFTFLTTDGGTTYFGKKAAEGLA